MIAVSAAVASGAVLPEATLGAQEPIPAGQTYKMRRPTMSVMFVVRGRRIVYYSLKPLMRCNHGRRSYFGGDSASGPRIHGFHQNNGHFIEKNGDGVVEENDLMGTVRRDTIVGTFRRWYEIQGRNAYRCGTGEVHGQTMHFVARRAGS